MTDKKDDLQKYRSSRDRLCMSETFQTGSLKNDGLLLGSKECNLKLISEFGDIKRKHKSCYGAFPSIKFGPKATIVDNEETQLTLQDPRYQMLKWCKPPQSCLVIKKIWDTLADNEFIGLIIWLVKNKHFDVFVEQHVMQESSISSNEEWSSIKPKVFIYNQLDDNLSGKVDLVICAGGDGTLIYASSLFQGSMPPVMAFHLGSLGFLAPFNFSKYQVEIDNALKGDEVGVMLRTRLSCMICRSPNLMNSSEGKDSNIHTATKNSKRFLALNEVVVDRGETPFLCHLDLYIDDIPVTVVQGDGLIISTPTGSTAYAAAAGASMVHPSVPAIIIAPICPHSLSFRPIIVPAGVEIKIVIPMEARSNAWVSFDGRQRQQLAKQTDVLTIRTSEYPLPTICNRDPIFDWFNQLASCLHWNVRKIQSPIPSSFAYSKTNGDELPIQR